MEFEMKLVLNKTDQEELEKIESLNIVKNNPNFI
jgi:hypothetical protein